MKGTRLKTENVEILFVLQQFLKGSREPWGPQPGEKVSEPDR